MDEPTVLGDVLARERRSERPALRGGGRELDYRRFITTAWKAGNFLRHLGVRTGSAVGVVGRTPTTVLSLFGATALGASVSIDPAEDDAFRAVIAPTEQVDGYEAGNRVGYGTEPEDPETSYFERDVWSENPVAPPETVAPDAPALVGAERTWTHAELLAAARNTVNKLAPSDTVACRAPLSDPGAVAAGVVAPLLVGACVLLPADGDTGTVAVANGDTPEARTLTPAR